jgi:predicted DNA-binding transcriptional regulator YafY
MSTTNATTAPTITAKSGMILPATITPQTDMNLMVACISIYHRFNERKVAYDTLEKVMEAMRDSSAVVVLYSDAKGELAARVLWPTSMTLSKDNNITARCYCTLRKQWRSFRLDRMLACHELTTPDDVEPAA